MSNLEEKGFFKRLFTKENSFTVLVIIISVSIIFMDIFTDTISTGSMFDAILIVLTFLAITNIIERETSHRETHQKIDKISEKLDKVNEPFFFKTNKLVFFRDLSEEAHEIFMAGGNLVSIINYNYSFFKEWLRKGKMLKIIIQNPDNTGLKNMNMPACNYSYDVYKKNIEITLLRLKELKSIPEANIQIRLSNMSPTQFIAIIDNHNGGRIMYVGLYLPEGDSESQPNFMLVEKDDEHWFNLFYKNYYEFLWNKSDEI